MFSSPRVSQNTSQLFCFHISRLSSSQVNLPKAGTVDAAIGRHGPKLGGQKVQQRKSKGTAGGFYAAPEEPSSIVGTKVATREEPRGFRGSRWKETGCRWKDVFTMSFYQYSLIEYRRAHAWIPLGGCGCTWREEDWESHHPTSAA